LAIADGAEAPALDRPKTRDFPAPMVGPVTGFARDEQLIRQVLVGVCSLSYLDRALRLGEKAHLTTPNVDAKTSTLGFRVLDRVGTSIVRVCIPILS